MNRNAQLVIEDGTVFEGTSIGVKGVATGELIFNTAHVGYQEALTDSSYTGQMIVFTSPHIGNVGCNFDDEESTGVKAAGLILRERPSKPSYWRSQVSLQDYLEKHQTVGIAEVDTRCLTQLLRTRGHLSACIISNGCSVREAQQLAQKFTEVNSARLLEKVSTINLYSWTRTNEADKPLIIVYDFGVKKNILRLLEILGCRVVVVPAGFSIEQVNSLHPDGIVLSNGPGDPLMYSQTISMVKALVKFDIPILGICLGHQLLGLALGADIEKLKFGHHGINHPIKDLATDRIYITSQNHNFAISDKNLPNELVVTHRSLFDNSIQGIQHRYKKIYGIQGHPEGCPGPIDLAYIFNKFLTTIFQSKMKWKEELLNAEKI